MVKRRISTKLIATAFAAIAVSIAVLAWIAVSSGTRILLDHEKRTLEAGCDEFETKPVKLPDLIEKIGKLLG